MTTTQDREEMTPVPGAADKPFGPVAAVFYASGIGAAVLGILTTLVEASGSIKSKLEWSKSVGALSGKTILGVAAFIISWVVMHAMFKDRDPDPGKVFKVTAILIAVGILLTFPTFFQMFAPAE